MSNEEREIRRKLRVLEHAEQSGNIRRTCRYFGVPRSLFYVWRGKYRARGRAGIARQKAVGVSYGNAIAPDVVEKVLHLRRTYRLGPKRIVWYMERYHDIRISDASVYRICRRHGMNRLPGHVGRRAVHTHRCEKQVPGHHVQIDVTFLEWITKRGKIVRRFQYTAIDDATRIRALKVYTRHTQRNAIDFMDYVIEKFPFRINMVRTDRGHEFQALFHWHLADRGIQHAYIKPRSPQLNGKVECSDRTDKSGFYQLLSYKDDVALEAKLAEWENFYNDHRPHGAFRGKTPYEALRDRLK